MTLMAVIPYPLSLLFYVQIPSISWEKDRKSLRLRYFTPSSASEHLLPFSLLATLHPQTGLPLTTPPFSPSPIPIPSLPQPGLDEEVVHVEVRGSYGVGVEWKGGASKIFPFDVLKSLVSA
ncbi:hypothetical protein EON65_15785 [archaeon]|nr:MAG: hypothetical protein EON65_15785 [archaeon]